jgi:hypothetical protein
MSANNKQYKMNMNTGYPLMSQDDLIIKILEFVCKNKNQNVITAALIQRDLFPELEVNDILDLFDVIQHKRIQQITIVEGNHKYLKYRVGLEEYVKSLKKMTKNEKLHRILEFICTENDKSRKSGFDSEEIAKAFTPEMNIYEVNALCKILLDNGDAKDCTTKDESAKRMVAILVVNATHNAYHTNKYLEEDEQFSIPINQNISGTNVIVGDITGYVKQEANSSVITEINEKPKWLKTLYWIIGILVGISVLITFFITIFKD